MIAYLCFQIWMWGQLRQQSTPEPKLTPFNNLNCVFANFSWPQVKTIINAVKHLLSFSS